MNPIALGRAELLKNADLLLRDRLVPAFGHADCARPQACSRSRIANSSSLLAGRLMAAVRLSSAALASSEAAGTARLVNTNHVLLVN